jgi:nicotinamidase-related amidase
MERKNLEELKKLLINVDMINGFVKEGGKLADSFIAHIIPEHLRLIKMILEENEGLVFIKDNHTEGCREFDRYKEAHHCIIGTEEAELVDSLKPYEENAFVYPKNSTSAIFAPHFMEDIKKMQKLKEIIITGCCTDICIMNLALPLQNYLDQVNSRVRVIVPKNAVETFEIPGHNRNEWNEMAFRFMNQAGIETPDVYKKEMR